MRLWPLIALSGVCLLALIVPISLPSHAQQIPSAQSRPDSAAQIVAPPYHQGGANPLSANETHPNAKRLASEVALALTHWDSGETAQDIAARHTAFADPAQALAMAQALHVPSSAAQGRIIYPQFGGLTDESASVMVVTEHMVTTSQGVFVFVRTFDIRLVIVDGRWQFSQLASVGGEIVPPPDTLSSPALAVLNDPRIELPDSARWDIFDGRISSNLLTVMARMAEFAPFGVVTLMSGHPINVYGTDRTSDHTRGLAVDVYRIGDELVIDGRAEGSLTHQMVQWLYDQPEVSRVGSPWALDGFGGRSFTDALHQDHLHIAVHP